MKIAAIDIETTGLDPNVDEILEIAIIVVETKTDRLEETVKRFHCYIKHKKIRGDIEALAMNKDIIEIISSGKSNRILGFHEARTELEEYLKSVAGEDKLVVAGKNVAGFDIPFLRNLMQFSGGLPFHHRTIDPTLYCLSPKDKYPPSLKECCERKGVPLPDHTATKDALCILDLLSLNLYGTPFRSR